MSKKIRLFSVALVVFVVVLVVFAGTALASYSTTPSPAFAVDHSKISQGPNDFHNLAPAGANPCDYCHIPHGAQGAFLWAKPITNSGLQIGQADVGKNTSDIEALCYSCHDGTTPVGGSTVSLGGTTVFSANYYNHRTTAASFVTNPATGAKRGPGRDCDLCHNPHDNANRNFLRLEVSTRVYDKNGTYVGSLTPPVTAPLNSRYATVIKGGDVCATCHEQNFPDGPYPGLRGTHPVYQPAGTSVFEDIPFTLSNPVPGSNANSVQPKAGAYDPRTDGSLRNGTRLFDPATGLKSTAANAVVMCESCHSPHGALPGTETENTAVHILNTMDAGSLCGNCH